MEYIRIEIREFGAVQRRFDRLVESVKAVEARGEFVIERVRRATGAGSVRLSALWERCYAIPQLTLLVNASVGKDTTLLAPMNTSSCPGI